MRRLSSSSPSGPTGRAWISSPSRKVPTRPAAVVYDACQAAKSRNADVLLCDTAGRLHNKKNLMNELSKIRRVIEREFRRLIWRPSSFWTERQDRTRWCRQDSLREVTDISGIVLTKLDGTPRAVSPSPFRRRWEFREIHRHRRTYRRLTEV